jgi:hypothetical protein
MKRVLAVALALCVPYGHVGRAQNAITQEGTVLQNAPVMFRGNNRARQGATVHGAPSGQTVMTGDSVVGGRCDYSAPTDAPGGYYKLCLDAANGKITLDGTKTPQSGLSIEINGAVYGFPGAGNGNVIGPAPTTVNELTIWNSADGTAIKNGANVEIGHTHAWPATFGSTPTTGLLFQVGAPWPAANQIPMGVFQGINSTMTIPTSFTNGPWPNANFAAYCDNQNSTIMGNSCVPYFSVAVANGNATTVAYGNNMVVSNGNKAGAFNGFGLGKDFGALFGSECDVNVFKKSGGATPAGYVRCYEAIGGGEVIPTGGATAYHVAPFASGVPWSAGFETADGAATAGIALGAFGPPGNSVHSQGINFRTYNNIGIERTATINATSEVASVDLDLFVHDDNGRIRFLNPGGMQYYIDGTGFHGVDVPLGSTATGPFIYINGMPAHPTGMPTNASTGRVPLVVDTVNFKICFYVTGGGGWKCATGS